MDCLLCSSPEQGNNENEDEEEKKNKSFRELGSLTGEKYARSLCQLLDLTSSAYQEYFLLPNIRFCLSCTHFVGTVTSLFEKLEQIQTQISESKNQVQQRLLNCQSPEEEREDPLHNLTPFAAKMKISVNTLRQEIIQNIQVHRNNEGNSDGLNSPTAEDEDRLEEYNEVNFEDVKTECIDDDDGFSTADNCWPLFNFNLIDAANNDHQQSSLPTTVLSTSISERTRSKRERKRSWKCLETDEETIMTEKSRHKAMPTQNQNKMLKIVITRLEETMLNRPNDEEKCGQGQTEKESQEDLPLSCRYLGCRRKFKNDPPQPVPIPNSKIQDQDRVFPCTISGCTRIFKHIANRTWHIRKSHKEKEKEFVKNDLPLPSKSVPDSNPSTGPGPKEVVPVPIFVKYNPETWKHRPLPCKILNCPIRFNCESSRRYHLRVIHKIIPQKRNCINNRQVRCTLSDCGKIFKNPSALGWHIRKIHKTFSSETIAKSKCNPEEWKDRPLPCTVLDCPVRFNCESSRRYHLRIVHKILPPKRSCRNNRQVRCTVLDCGKIFKNASALGWHIRKIHKTFSSETVAKCNPEEWKDRPLPCKVLDCPMRFNCESSRRYHLRIIHKIIPKKRNHGAGPLLPCTVPDCGKKFKNASGRSWHIRSMHEKIPPNRNTNRTMTKCPNCPKTFDSTTKLETHIRIHTGETPFVCEHCGKGFRAESFLNEHLKYHRNELLYPCPECTTKCISKWALQAHIHRVHKKDKSFMCELCSSAFLAKSELENHQAKFHSKELNLNPLKCRICDKILSSPQYLRIHEKAHSGEGLKFKCNVEGCSSGFDRASRLRSHMVSHSEERNHLCTKCGKSFKSKRQLDIHLVTHGDNRPFKCSNSNCSSAFKTLTCLKRHLAALHSNVNPFTCLLCGEKFPVKRKLDRHIVKHTTGKVPIPGQTQEET